MSDIEAIDDIKEIRRLLNNARSSLSQKHAILKRTRPRIERYEREIAEFEKQIKELVARRDQIKAAATEGAISN